MESCWCVTRAIFDWDPAQTPTFVLVNQHFMGNVRSLKKKKKKETKMFIQKSVCFFFTIGLMDKDMVAADRLRLQKWKWDEIYIK